MRQSPIVLASCGNAFPVRPVLVLPTVLFELEEAAENGRTDELRHAARIAFARLRRPWNFRPVNFIPIGHGAVQRIGQTLRDNDLIPADQINDSYLVAEAGLMDASILLSSDAHLKDIPHAELRLLMDAADVRTPLIASPWKIVHQFFR